MADAPACVAKPLVPRTRSSHDFAAGTVANFGFKSGTRIIDLLVSLSIPKFAQSSLRMLANFGIGTLALLGDGRPRSKMLQEILRPGFVSHSARAICCESGSGSPG